MDARDGVAASRRLLCSVLALLVGDDIVDGKGNVVDVVERWPTSLGSNLLEILSHRCLKQQVEIEQPSVDQWLLTGRHWSGGVFAKQPGKRGGSFVEQQAARRGRVDVLFGGAVSLWAHILRLGFVHAKRAALGTDAHGLDLRRLRHRRVVKVLGRHVRLFAVLFHVALLSPLARATALHVGVDAPRRAAGGEVGALFADAHHHSARIAAHPIAVWPPGAVAALLSVRTAFVTDVDVAVGQHDHATPHVLVGSLRGSLTPLVFLLVVLVLVRIARLVWNRAIPGLVELGPYVVKGHFV